MLWRLVRLLLRSAAAGPGRSWPFSLDKINHVQGCPLSGAEHAAPAKRHVRIAVIIPAGPHDDILDTLASVVHYTGPSRVIVVIDDKSPLGSDATHIHDLSPDIAVVPAPGEHGADGRLWVKLAAGYRWLLERYQPGIVLRLDADALLIGYGIEAAAEKAFAESPDTGLLGSYRIGPDGQKRDFSPVVREIHAETGLPGLRHLRCRSHLRRHLRVARGHGYIDGEHALGGAYIHSYQAASWMYENGLLDQPWLAVSRLGEDHIMALLTVAGGYRIGDFGGPADPIAVKWKGLPAHPDDLLAAGKLITHSVRFWQDLDERCIRSIFAQARNGGRG